MVMHLSELVTDFLEHLEIEQNRSQRTIANYDHYLRRVVDFADDCDISKLDAEMVRQFRLWLARFKDEHGEDLSKATQNYHLIALRSFLKYLAKRDIKALTSDKIELAKTVRPKVSFLEPEELDRLFGAIKTDTPVGLRDRAILELLFSGGLRVSELVNLDRDHLNTDVSSRSVARGKRTGRSLLAIRRPTGWNGIWQPEPTTLSPSLSTTPVRRTGATTCTRV